MKTLFLSNDEISVLKETIIEKLQSMHPDVDDCMVFDVLDDILSKLKEEDIIEQEKYTTVDEGGMFGC